MKAGQLRRGVAIMQRHSKLCVSTSTCMFGLQDWADLPKDLLQSVFSRLGSILDLLAFVATCRSWRVALTSYSSKSTLCTLFPPLLIQPNIRVHVPHPPCNNGHRHLQAYKVIDPAKQSATGLHCHIDEEILQTMRCAGPSYGQLIFYNRGHCVVVIPFRGTKVSPPRLPLCDDYRKLNWSDIPFNQKIMELQQLVTESYCSAILTAPLASPNSHMLVSTGLSLFSWPVGSDTWSELQCSGVQIIQIVEFNGQFIAMDLRQQIYTLEVAPKLRLQEITTNHPPDLTKSSQDPSKTSWLVVCGDMLLMLVHSCTSIHYNASVPFVRTVHYLDMSTKPAKWVDMEKLDNWAIFTGSDIRSTSFSCMNPEHWGGRSKCLYVARSPKPWSEYGLGNEPDPSVDPVHQHFRIWCHLMQPLWVYPSMLYSDGP
ncbi:hypothetical protein CFC21_102089 [Triticum aestivum]|uniref:F-box domain-containing protein n=2 Tax=Triticum aestivum TaxID=4565 RepID=A0A3B6SGZ2_WHEAT|nr:hypothetical protein CFC21_102089 [Triticum aestivum]